MGDGCSGVRKDLEQLLTGLMRKRTVLARYVPIKKRLPIKWEAPKGIRKKSKLSGRGHHALFRRKIAHPFL